MYFNIGNEVFVFTDKEASEFVLFLTVHPTPSTLPKEEQARVLANILNERATEHAAEFYRRQFRNQRDDT